MRELYRGDLHPILVPSLVTVGSIASPVGHFDEMSDAALAMSTVDRERGLAMLEETIKMATSESPYSMDNIRRTQLVLARFLLEPQDERFCFFPKWYSVFSEN